MIYWQLMCVIPHLDWDADDWYGPEYAGRAAVEQARAEMAQPDKWRAVPRRVVVGGPADTPTAGGDATPTGGEDDQS